MKTLNSFKMVLLLAALAALGCNDKPEEKATQTMDKTQSIAEVQNPSGKAERFRQPIVFREMDADEDGFVTMAELTNAFLLKMDADGDGAISREE